MQNKKFHTFCSDVGFLVLIFRIREKRSDGFFDLFGS